MTVGPAWTPQVVRAAVVIPAALIVLFMAPLWLLGLACGTERRQYVMTLSRQAMDAVTGLVQSAPEPPQPPAGPGDGREL